MATIRPLMQILNSLLQRENNAYKWSTSTRLLTAFAEHVVDSFSCAAIVCPCMGYAMRKAAEKKPIDFICIRSFVGSLVRWFVCGRQNRQAAVAGTALNQTHLSKMNSTHKNETKRYEATRRHGKRDRRSIQHRPANRIRRRKSEQ